MAVRMEAGDLPWLRFLSWWALLAGLLSIALIAVFIVGVGFEETGSFEQGLINAAGRNPSVVRLAEGLDVLTWLGIGGLLLGFAGVLFRRAPVRSAVLAGCAAGQLVGAVGGPYSSPRSPTLPAGQSRGGASSKRRSRWDAAWCSSRPPTTTWGSSFMASAI